MGAKPNQPIQPNPNNPSPFPTPPSPSSGVVEPDAVSTDPIMAQRQAHVWRLEVIQCRYTIADLRKQLEYQKE